MTIVSFRDFSIAAAVAAAAAVAVAAYVLSSSPVFAAEVPVPITVSTTALYRGELVGPHDVKAGSPGSAARDAAPG